MISAPITIAWTPGEAVLFGPESRLVRLTLAEDDDRPALILETWRTEFPEITAAQLLAGGQASVAPDAQRLAQLATKAGLKLELAPPTGELRGQRGGWAAIRSRLKLRPRLVAGAFGLMAAILAGFWQWGQARERERVSKLTAAERESEMRQAETAEMSRRRQATTEQSRALLAACTAPRQFMGSWLEAIGAAMPPSLVLDAIEVNGARCRVTGKIVAGAPGAESAVENLKQAIFSPLSAWTIEKAPNASAGQAFRLEATFNESALPAAGPEPSSGAAEAARARLPDKIAVEALIEELAPAWRIENRGSNQSVGIEQRRYALAAIHSDPSAWQEVQKLARKLSPVAGLAIDSLTLTASPGETGAVERAAVEISVRLR